MYIHVLFGSIAIEIFNISGGLPQASDKRLSDFWPIPPDKTNVTEPGV